MVSAAEPAWVIAVRGGGIPAGRQVRVEVVPGLARASVGVPTQPLTKGPVGQPLGFFLTAGQVSDDAGAATRIEIMFGRLKEWGWIATRYGRHPTVFWL